jgi:hypothetical protein
MLTVDFRARPSGGRLKQPLMLTDEERERLESMARRARSQPLLAGELGSCCLATRAAESGMEVATLAAILGRADLRSVMKYVHVRQESQDREMELFEARNISEAKHWSGFGPVGTAENREIGGSSGKHREGLSNRKIN